MPLPEIVSVLTADISQFQAKMGIAQKEMQATAKTGATSKAALQGVSIGLMAAGAAFSGVGAVLVGASGKIETAQATLRTVIENTGQSWDAYRQKIDDAVSHEERFGHGSADTQEALAKLTAAFQDPRKALSELNIVTEIAAFKHISLSDAAALDVKMHAGAGKVFKEFGINVMDQSKALAAAAAAAKLDESATAALDKAKQHLADIHALLAGKTKLTTAEQLSLTKATDAVHQAQMKAVQAHEAAIAAQAKAKGATKDYADIIQNQLLPRIKGVAEAQSDTFGGKMDMIKTKVENFTGTIGKVLGPALVALGPILIGVGGVMQIAMIPGFAGAAVAVWSFLAPILLVVAAVALVVGAFVLAYTHIKPFRDAVNQIAAALKTFLIAALNELSKIWTAVWPVIQKTVEVVWAILKPIFGFMIAVFGVELKVALTVLGAAFSLIWRAISGAVQLAWFLLKPIFGFIGDQIGNVQAAIQAFAPVWNTIWQGISDAVSTVWNFLKPIFDAIGKGISAISSGVGALKGVAGALGLIPHFAEGGPVPGAPGEPLLAVLHGGEYVVSNRMQQQGGIGGGSTVIHVHVAGDILSPDGLANTVRDALLRQGRNLYGLGLA